MGSVARSTLATARPNRVGFWQRLGIALRRPFEPLPHRRAYALPQPPIPSQLVRPLSPVELRWLLVRLLPLFAVEPLPHRRVYARLMLQRPLPFVRQPSPVQVSLFCVESSSNFMGSLAEVGREAGSAGAGCTVWRREDGARVAAARAASALAGAGCTVGFDDED
jgi:hypothetical protein